MLTETEPMSLSERLRSLRKKADLSQEQLAKQSGVTTSLVAKLEQGLVKSPGIETVKAIARCLQVRIVDLVGEEDWPCDTPSGSDSASPA